MSDTRRRRKSNQSCGSDDLSDSCEELNATKETQSSEQTDGHQDSECDIYVSDSEVESQDGALRESGDGQEEEKPQKKLDDDEDRRNPQYIPKRGTFYEHDDRTADEVPENNPEVPNERETKEKKVWKDKEDRWDHDRYNDEEQAPKSHEELIAVYGYDIRNEEGPPRARRRRRYGRGPNKYTRNWEDEDAYGKTGTPGSGRGGRRFNRTGEDFPALGANKNASAQVEEPVVSSAWYSSKNKSQNKVQNFPPLQSQNDTQKTKNTGGSNAHTNENKAPNESGPNSSWKKETKQASQNQSSNGNNGPGGDAEKLGNAKISPRDNKRNVQESVSLAASRARGRGFKANANNNTVTSRSAETKPKGRGAGPITPDNRRNNVGQNEDDQQHTHDSKHSVANDGVQYHQGARQNKSFYGHSPNQQRSNTASSRMQQQQQQQQQSHSQQQQQQPQAQQQTIQQQQPQQDGSGNRPKRYSSLRQRPTLPESPGQPNYPAQHGQHGQHGYFPPQGYPQGHFEQSGPVPAAAAPMPAPQPVISLPPSGQPASYAPPPFLVPPPQFIPPQTAPPSIINYVPGPNGPAFQPNFQGYRGYSPAAPVQPQRPPPPPQELFQPQGCTYYSPAQQQQQQQQSAPMRRPKAAIPILPPPDNQQHHQSRGRGRSTQQQQQQQQQQQPQSPQQGSQANVDNGQQHSEQEPKQDYVDQVPEQFDSAPLQQQDELYDNSDKNVEASEKTDNVAESEEKNNTINIGVEPTPDPHELTTDRIDGGVPNQTEAIIEADEPIPAKSVPVFAAKTENDLNEIEKATSEINIVEEAVA